MFLPFTQTPMCIYEHRAVKAEALPTRVETRVLDDPNHAWHRRNPLTINFQPKISTAN